jgi:acetamidase/formamidase
LVSLEVRSLHPTPDQYGYVFGGRGPLLRVAPGTVVELSTQDCFGGAVRSAADLPSQVCSLATMNPVTGPIAVEGAEVGDMIAVHFVEILPARDWAVSSTFPYFGALTATSRTAMLHPALPERVWVYEIDKDSWTCRFTTGNGAVFELPLDPMHGTVGVAPAAGEVMMTLTPAAHGGNMDTPELRAGVTAYFPVNVPGGLLSIGDGHARQGEGEVCGTAVESAMNTVVVVDLVKGHGSPSSPRLESDTHLVTTGSARPLEDAFRMSQRDLVCWTAGLLGLDDLDAYQLVSQAGLAPVANVVDTNYTMTAKLPKSVLGGVAAYDGIHDRLRAAAGEYLSRR